MQKTANCNRYSVPGLFSVASPSTSVDQDGGQRPAQFRRLWTQMYRVMRITAFILFVCCMHVSANSFSQTVTLAGKNITLKKVFTAVEQQTGYLIFSNRALLDNTKPITISVKDMPLNTFLDKVLTDQPIAYKIENRTISLYRKLNSAVNNFSRKEEVAIPILMADVSGVITSADGTPLAGATVLVKNSQKYVVTNEAGRFQIEASIGDVLVVSFVGYNPKEVAITDKNISNLVSIKLEEVSALMDQVEIVVAYGRQSKSSYTGAASVVTAKDLEGKPRASFQESLQGNVAGLQSTSGTGQPGASGNVRIRGIGSYAAGSSPLYVVDNVPFVDGPTTVLAFSSNTLAGINPNDIESVTVLKDASATAIYGSRGANGVILITTKSGKAGKSKINLSAQTGYSQIAMNERNKPLSTREMTELLIEGVINSNATGLSGINTNEAAYQYLIDQGLKPNVNTDWFDVITQRGKFQQYDLSLSGGNDKTSVFASAGYYKQDATVKGQGFERFTSRLRVKHKASNSLSINAGFAPSYQKLSTIPNSGTGANPIRSLNRLVPWVAPYNENGTYSGILYNPEIVRNENKYDTRIYALLGDFGAELKITPDLVAETKVGIDFSYTDDYRFWSPLWVDAASVRGRGAEYTSLFINWSVTNLLKYNRNLGDFGLDATLGQEAQKITRKYISTQADEYAQAGLYTLSSAAKPFVAWSNEGASALVSYFLNTSVNYKRKLYLNLTGRIDGSSRFGKSVRYGKFGSIGFAWNLSDEDIIANLGFVKELKIRSSFGVNGNQAPDWYGVLGEYSTSGSYNASPAYILRQIQNDFLTWEKNKPFDIGVEFSLFDNRLSGSFDYYQRITSDLLMSADISAVNGLGTQNRNIGSFENSGIELSLTSQNIRANKPLGFNWNTSFNISTNKNQILTLSGVDQIITGNYNRVIGGNYYEFYMPGWAGVDPQTGEGLWYVDGTKNTTTNKFTDARPFNQGSALPRFFGGLTNTFEYKNFTLSFMFYFNWGNKLFDTWGAYTSNDASAGVTDYGAIARVDYENRWQKPGDVTSTPKMVYRGSQTGVASQTSSRFMYDGSYIRLRDVFLSYDLPVKNTVLTKAQLFLRANNLFTYVKDDRLRHDPETYVDGLINQNLPISTQVLVGVNLSF
ncbi:SusC/RagA family TonB-linked outer membrane protein [Gynurincola endophyticus]|uniref:SusC/RagA family TonB-linked outer membrane protein n=1 Tax=Gynurincola endophyticus TaxID=2479004 RepID=UPI000F8F35D2|nr:SusC/RagA family TonB-linked outer membrane protein [Gynurincola endophyticus]